MAVNAAYVKIKGGRHGRSRPLLLAFLVAAWLLAVLVGFVVLLQYETKPGAQAILPASWPGDCSVARDPSHNTLVMFVHPHCPCTTATIDELSVLLSHCPQLQAFVFFVRPAGVTADWEHTSLWKQARQLKGVTVLVDDQGKEATRFGALTSGLALVYNAQGRRVFAGGITPGRGHEGDNAGVDAIIAILRGFKPQHARTEVFGCSLLDNHSSDTKRLAPLWRQ